MGIGSAGKGGLAAGTAWASRLSWMLARRTALILAAGWLVLTPAFAVLFRFDAATALLLSLTGLAALSLLNAHRNHHLVIAELARIQGRAESTAGERPESKTDEILDRLKLSALSLSRLAEDLTQFTKGTAQIVLANMDELYREAEALHNLYAMIPVAARIPPLSRQTTPADMVLALVELLRTRKPALVVECGAGASTLWCALAMRHFGLGGRVVALEDDPNLAQATENLLAAHDVAHFVEVRHAPLESVSLCGQEWRWYASRAWEDLQSVDVLFVGGPSSVLGESARFPALPVLCERLADGAYVLLDGTVRGTPHAVVDRWLAAIPAISLDHLITDSRTGVLRVGRALPDLAQTHTNAEGGC